MTQKRTSFPEKKQAPGQCPGSDWTSKPDKAHRPCALCLVSSRSLTELLRHVVCCSLCGTEAVESHQIRRTRCVYPRLLDPLEESIRQGDGTNQHDTDSRGAFSEGFSLHFGSVGHPRSPPAIVRLLAICALCLNHPPSPANSDQATGCGVIAPRDDHCPAKL